MRRLLRRSRDCGGVGDESAVALGESLAEFAWQQQKEAAVVLW